MGLNVTQAVNEGIDNIDGLSEARERFSHWKENVQELDQQIRHTIRRRPVASLFAALLGGYLAGRIVTRL